MKQAVIRLENGNATLLTDIPAADLPGAVLWVDVEGTHKELATFFDPVVLPPSVLYKALAQESFPTAAATQDYILLTLPIRQTWDQKQPGSITFILQSHRVITLHEENNYNFQTTRKELLDGGGATLKNAAALLLYLFESLIETNILCFMEARSHTELLSTRIDNSPRSVSEREVMYARRQVSHLLSQFEDQFYGLADLQALTTHPQLEEKIRKKIHDIGEAQNHLARNLLRLESRLRDLEQHCQFVLQQQTDQRIRQLTVLTTIFLPLTLHSGIYGMNFSFIPGTSWKYSFHAMIACMVIIALALLYYLKRRGWFH